MPTIPDTLRFAVWDGEVPPTAESLATALREEGFDAPELLTDTANAEHGLHQHDTAQLLVVISGSMGIRTKTGSLNMDPGDRLYLPPHTEHSAKIGPNGVTYFDYTYPIERNLGR